MEFPPYTEKQLKEILVSRARRAGFSKYKPSALSGSAAPGASNIAAVDDYSNDLEAFGAIINAVMPQFLYKTRHVSDLWENAMTLWGFIFYSSNPSLFITTRTASLSSASCTAITAPTSKAASLPENARFQIDLKALRMAAQDVLLMPAIHVTSVQEPRKRRTWSGRESSTAKSADSELTQGRARLLKHQKRLSSDIACGAAQVTLPIELQQAVPEEINMFLDLVLCKCHDSSEILQCWLHQSSYRNE